MAVDLSQARAVFSDAFQFPGQRLDPAAPPMIERDRLVMAAQPGMIRKLLPLRQDRRGVFCGGCYGFDSFENAKAYGEWCAHGFVLDGTLFLDRAPFLEPISQLWHIVGAEDFGDVASQQTIMRFERWYIPTAPDLAQLQKDAWGKVRSRAKAEGFTTAWLLLGPDPHHPQLGLVTAAAGNVKEASLDAEQSASIRHVEGLRSPAADLAASLSGTKAFNRTSWIYMIWHPIKQGDTSPLTAQWPASPPLPGLKAYDEARVAMHRNTVTA